MAGILALDLATTVGWAHRPAPTDAPSYGSIRLPKTGGDVGQYLAAFRMHMRRWLADQEPEHVVFESPVLPPKTQIATLRKLYSLAGVTELICADVGIKCTEAHMQSARKHFLGSGRPGKDREAIKVAVLNACWLRGWKPDDDNAADALCILDYSAHLIWRDHPDLAFEHWKRGAA